MLELGTLVKGVSRFVAKTPAELGRIAKVDWKRFHLIGQTGLVGLIRRVSTISGSRSSRRMMVSGPRCDIRDHRLGFRSDRLRPLSQDRSIQPFLPAERLYRLSVRYRCEGPDEGDCDRSEVWWRRGKSPAGGTADYPVTTS